MHNTKRVAPWYAKARGKMDTDRFVPMGELFTRINKSKKSDVYFNLNNGKVTLTETSKLLGIMLSEANAKYVNIIATSENNADLINHAIAHTSIDEVGKKVEVKLPKCYVTTSYTDKPVYPKHEVVSPF